MKDIITKLDELYIQQHGHYLIQNKNGQYYQLTAGHTGKNQKKVPRLKEWHFINHLQGKFTIGTFGGKLTTRFMTFDVDFHNPEMAKWITLKVTRTLDDLGIDYHISSSGSKGYHIDLFFEDLIQIKDAEKFFVFVITKSEIRQHSDAGNKVEFRVTDKLGVKLPLGKHQKTGNYCGFCLVEDGLKVMSKEASEAYLLSITKMASRKVLDVLEIEDEIEDTVKFIKTEEVISQHKPLDNYEQSEEYSISQAEKLLRDGLQFQGSRHKAVLLLSIYLRGRGYESEDCRNELYAWMEWQNPESYTTPLKDCYKDIDQVVKDTYEKGYSLRSNTKDLSVTLPEIRWIIEKCPQKNQKLITYAMLIHSKRHANPQGVFYMPFNNIATTTGLAEETARSQVNKLITLGVIEVVERNRIPKGKGLQRKLPNLYRMNVVTDAEKSIDESEVFVTEQMNDFKSCLLFYFKTKELQELLPRRQYESLIAC